jgi:shikimate dehydrogenase
MRLGLIGRAIAHSPSPALHRWALAQAGIAGDYDILDCADADAVARAIERLRRGEFAGLNVTQPWKGEVRLGLAVPSVNTLWRDGDGQVRGESTDGIGLVDVIGPGIDAGRVLILGTGGAATAVALALAECGLPLAIMGRNPARVARLVSHLGARAVGCGWGTTVAEVSLVVHATSLGHAGTHDPATSTALAALPWASWHSARLVDLVYALDGPTPFESCAAERGLHRCQTGAGKAVLCAQACRSQWRWTGRLPDWRAMHAAVFGAAYQEYMSAPVGSG